MPKIYGYARVSSKSQNLSRQLKILKQHHCNKIFAEKISGKNTNRPKLNQMLNSIKPKDTVIVSSIDRLGRNMNDDVNLIRIIRKKKANVYLADFPISKPPKKSNSETKNQFESRLTTYHYIVGNLIRTLSYVAEIERREIRERQRQGIKIAKNNHKYKGRKRQFYLSDPNVKTAINQYFHKRISHLSTAEIARMHKISISEFYKLIRAFKQRN